MGTASDEDGIAIHRIVLFCFLASMLIRGLGGEGLSGLEKDCSLGLGENVRDVGSAGD